MEEKVVRDRVARVLATWFGCGLIRGAPGTMGTLGAIPLYLLLRPHGPLAVALAAMILTAVGVWAADVVAKKTQIKDPQFVVIDEVAGVLITLIAAPPTWRALLLGFVLFRLLDQWKPWPARQAERNLPGGWGIVFDDVAAGAWGAIAIVILHVLGVV